MLNDSQQHKEHDCKMEPFSVLKALSNFELNFKLKSI